MEPLIIEETYAHHRQSVWNALTTSSQISEWHFDIPEFKPETGFDFTFHVGEENERYLYQGRVIEVSPGSKLSYSWEYPGQPGFSIVAFELFDEPDGQTKIRLTHEGIDTFRHDDPRLSRERFRGYWTVLLGKALKQYLDRAVNEPVIRVSRVVAAPANAVWDILLHSDTTWGAASSEGAFVETDWQPGSDLVWTDLDGNISARGIISQRIDNEYLKVDMYDDINPQPGTVPGDYSEEYRVKHLDDCNCELTIKAGPLPDSVLNKHHDMWQKALDIIQKVAESPGAVAGGPGFNE